MSPLDLLAWSKDAEAAQRGRAACAPTGRAQRHVCTRSAACATRAAASGGAGRRRRRIPSIVQGRHYALQSVLAVTERRRQCQNQSRDNMGTPARSCCHLHRGECYSQSQIMRDACPLGLAVGVVLCYAMKRGHTVNHLPGHQLIHAEVGGVMHDVRAVQGGEESLFAGPHVHRHL